MHTSLTAAEFSATQRPTGSAHGLPNRFYTALDAAHAERDAVLAKTWTCIGFASDLRPNQARAVDLLGLPLMVVRDAQGETRVFHNVCRHRGHRLVADTCDLEGSIRCPYHRWTYACDGRLRGTPHIGGQGVHEVDGFDKSQRGLHHVRSAVWLDLLYVNISGDAAPFADYIAPLVARWAAFIGDGGFDRLYPAVDDGRMQLDLNCNWKLAVENYCESYHLPWVHPGLNSYSRLEDHYNLIGDGWGAGQGTRTFEFTERAGISLPRFEQWPVEKLKVAEYIALFPNVLLGLQNDHLFAIVLQPLAPDRTRERVQIYYVGEETLGPQFENARSVMLEGWREVFVEDVDVCEGMQLGRASPAYDGGAFSPALDTATHHFHQWVANRLPVEGRPS